MDDLMLFLIFVPNQIFAFHNIELQMDGMTVQIDADETKYVSQNISYCQNIRKHRFQCSPEQQTCLPVSRLSDIIFDFRLRAIIVMIKRSKVMVDMFLKYAVI